MNRGGKTATAHELLARFPAGTVEADAELTALRAAGELTQGSLAEAERQLALAAWQADSGVRRILAADYPLSLAPA